MTRNTISFTLLLFVTACSGATTADGSSSGASDTFGVCGDGVVGADEVCDGTDLAGQSCTDLPGYVGGTLACAADCTSFDPSACTADLEGAVVRFNEITASEITEGPYAGAGDAIELYNVGGAAADLSGFLLSDAPDFPPDKTYVFPEGTMLAPGELVVLVKLDDITGEGDYSFGISSTDPETLRLADASAALVDTVDFVGLDAVVSWCRLPDGEGEWQTCARTFGEANAAGGGGDETTTGPSAECGNGTVEAGEACDGTDLGGVACTDLGPQYDGGDLACSPVCTLDPSGCTLAPGAMLVVVNEISSGGDDPIEIHNAGARPVDLSGWIVTDDITDPGAPYDARADLEEYVFPPGTMLAAGGFVVVIAGDAPDGHPFGLSGEGDAVTLLDAAATVVDHVVYSDMQAAASYCRIPDGPAGGWQPDCTPTFGASNQGG